MRIRFKHTTSGFDFDPLFALVEPMFVEADQLQFSEQGWMLNPDTGIESTEVALIQGHHLRPGATYAFTSTPIERDEDEDDEGEAGEEEASEPPEPFFVSVDSAQRSEYKLRMVSESSIDRLAIHATLHRSAHPSIEGRSEFTMDVGEWPSKYFHDGSIQITGRLQSAAFLKNGMLIEGTAAGSGFKASGSVQVRHDEEEMMFDVTMKVTGRGLARPLVFGASPFIKWYFRRTLRDELIKDFALDGPALRADLAVLGAATRTRPDRTTFVHRCLWEEGFAEEHFLPTVARLQEEELVRAKAELDATLAAMDDIAAELDE